MKTPLLVERRRLLVAAIFASHGFHAFARVTGYPTKPIKLVVPYAAGSGTDFVARILSEELQSELGVPVIVDNRPGANGTIGSDFVAKAAPDGYTLLVGGSSTHSSAPSLFKALPYDSERDFEMIANVVESQFLLVVRGDSPIRSVKELRVTIEANRDKASFGFGSATTQIAGASFVKRMALTVIPIPYKSNPPAITDLIGGIVDFLFLDQTTAMPQIKSGKLRALAVASQQRMTELPETPTLAETGLLNFNVQTWLGILVPRGVVPAIADELAEVMGRIMNKRTIRERLSVTGRPLPQSPRSTFPGYLKVQREAWALKIRESGIQPE